MADELKLNVSVAGAAKAEADLRAVAGAEQQVVSGATQTGTAAKAAARDHADLGRELFGVERAGQEWRKVLGLLPPEIANAVEQVVSLGRATSVAAIGMNVIALAGVGLAMVFNQLGQAEAKARQDAEAVGAALQAQYQTYLDMARAIQDVVNAEREMTAGREGRTFQAETGRALEAAKGTTLGKKGVQTVAAAGETLTDEQLAAFAMWLDLGYGRGETDPIALREQFLAEWKADANLAARLRGEEDALFRRGPELFAQGQRERGLIAAGMTPEAQGEAALNAFVEAEKVKGNILKQTKVRRDLQRHATRRMSPRWGLPSLVEQDQEAAFAGWIAEHPELGAVTVKSPTGQTVTINALFQGGTHYHQGDRFNPAGRIERTTR